MTEPGDRTLICSTCGQSFTFTEGEQEFFRKKGFLSPPKRCPDCRRERRERSRGSESRVYRAPTFASGPPAWKEYRSPAFREYDAAAMAADRPRRPTYPVTCVQCGVETQIPFRPVEGKQYYCRECYRALKGP